MRRTTRHLLVCLLLAIAAVALTATQASALVVHLPDGHTAGLQLSAGVKPTAVSGSSIGRSGDAALADNGTVNYDGGPVLHATRPYLVFWDPTGSGVTTTSRHVLEQYLTDVAADSTESHDTYGVARQYYDSTGFASVSQTFSQAVQAISDTQAYPAPGCSLVTGYTHCVTDAQIQTELARLIGASGLPTGIGSPAPIYFVVTPPTTDVCADSQDCADPSSPGEFCAYHSNFTDAGSQVVYAAMPFSALKPGAAVCQSDNPAIAAVQEPNGDDADVVADNLSHEDLESITDPLPATPAWVDNTTQNEVADNCQAYGAVANETNTGGPVNPNAYSPTLGGNAANGTLYDQLINGDHYYTQTLWSNGDVNCDAQPAAGNVTPAFTPSASTVLTGTSVTFNTGGSTSTAGVSSSTWSFGDGASSFAPGAPGSISHTFAAPGSYSVTLTLVDSLGNLATTTHTVTVQAPSAPTASFTASPATGVAGSAIAFDGSGSTDPNVGGAIASYGWSFDDGTTSSGAHVTHAFALPGSHSVTLTVSDTLGLSSHTTQTIVVARAGVTTTPGGSQSGRITGIAVRKVKGAEFLVVSVSGSGVVRFGSKTVTLKGPGKASFKLTITKAQRRRLARHHSVSESLTIVYTPLGGARVTKTEKLTIRP